MIVRRASVILGYSRRFLSNVKQQSLDFRPQACYRPQPIWVELDLVRSISSNLAFGAAPQG